jgi:tetratricopeptide (TPR) repeat protein
MNNPMRSCFKILIRAAALAALCCTVLARAALATGTEPSTVAPIDPAPCVAAAAAGDADRIISVCGALVDSDKTAKADRVKALIARAGAFSAKDQIDRAIGDYDTALRLDPALADIFNARGELWRRKGDRPRALQDFGAALKLDSRHAAARANYKSLAQELERLGAEMALANRPGFNCSAARGAAEKAICASPELASLDRRINVVNARVVRDASRGNPSAGRALQREQDEFIARRNGGFGRSGYDLQKAMRERLDHLLAIGSR